MISWHRFYDPETGRYISADPIGLDGGVNLYAYANQNPISNIDPYGLWVKRCARNLNLSGNLDIDKAQHLKPKGSPVRHDYLNISGEIRSYVAGSNVYWSQGRVNSDEHRINSKCTTICNDDKFDKYVLDAAKYEPTYNIAAYPGTTMYLFGARNCQSWASEVIERAKEEY